MSIQHMLLLSLLHVPPRMPTEMGSAYQNSLCVDAHARPRLWNKRRVLWGTVGKEHIQSDSHSVCVHVQVCVCLFEPACACVWVFAYVWEGRLCWSVPESWKWQGGTVGKKILAVCAETDHGGGAVPLASGHLQQHVWKSKNTLLAMRARFNHCDKRKRARHLKQTKNW